MVNCSGNAHRYSLCECGVAKLEAINAELLEALEALADDVQGVTPNRNRLTRIAACKAARAAIAKAKGESL